MHVMPEDAVPSGVVGLVRKYVQGRAVCERRGFKSQPLTRTGPQKGAGLLCFGQRRSRRFWCASLAGTPATVGHGLFKEGEISSAHRLLFKVRPCRFKVRTCRFSNSLCMASQWQLQNGSWAFEKWSRLNFGRCICCMAARCRAYAARSIYAREHLCTTQVMQH